MFDELRYNARQAAAHLRMASNVLGVHGKAGGEEFADLEHRLRSAPPGHRSNGAPPSETEVLKQLLLGTLSQHRLIPPLVSKV